MRTADVGTVADLYKVVKGHDNNFVSGKEVKRAFVNEDGTPKIVYHGTFENFTAFDRTKGRANMDIQGMFFSPRAEEAADYGDKVGRYYLSIPHQTVQRSKCEASADRNRESV